MACAWLCRFAFGLTLGDLRKLMKEEGLKQLNLITAKTMVVTMNMSIVTRTVITTFELAYYSLLCKIM